MSPKQTDQRSLNISQDQLQHLVRGLLGLSQGREDDEHPLPPGPWDPVIRGAWERTIAGGLRAGSWKVALAELLARHPEAFDAVGGGHSHGDEVALNPQPLPPRFSFLLAVAQAVILRAELLQEIAGAIPDAAERGIIIVGGYTRRFSDDWCAPGFRLRFPLGGPRPHWFKSELGGIDLIVLAAQFEGAAKEAFGPVLRRSFAEVSAKFLEVGLAKLVES